MNKTIVYKPDTAFDTSGGKIRLKKYNDSLVTLGTLDLTNRRSKKEPIINNNAVL